MSEPTSDIDWRWKLFDDLTNVEVYAMLAARSNVFVVEQKCVYADIDGLDAGAWHLLAYGSSADGQPALAGYLRVLLPSQSSPSSPSSPSSDETDETDIRIGRVLTTQAFRGKGLGQQMIERALAHIARQWPHQPVRLHAQAHLQRFYGAFGFKAISDIHLEDDIPHVWMRRV
jgi:ElaA protein